MCANQPDTKPLVRSTLFTEPAGEFARHHIAGVRLLRCIIVDAQATAAGRGWACATGLTELPPDELKARYPLVGEDITGVLTPAGTATSRAVRGGTHPAQVQALVVRHPSRPGLNQDGPLSTRTFHVRFLSRVARVARPPAGHL